MDAHFWWEVTQTALTRSELLSAGVRSPLFGNHLGSKPLILQQEAQS